MNHTPVGIDIPEEIQSILERYHVVVRDSNVTFSHPNLGITTCSPTVYRRGCRLIYFVFTVRFVKGISSMNVGTMNENQPKAAITVSKMCSLLSMSRSQFYWHVKKGTFHAPNKLSNGRPFYNASQVEDNLKAREMGIGVNGEYVLFYQRDAETPNGTSSPQSKSKPKQDYTELMDGLAALGLTGLTTSAVGEAVEQCYPKGTIGQDENDILRTVFRHLKRSGSV